MPPDGSGRIGSNRSSDNREELIEVTLVLRSIEPTSAGAAAAAATRLGIGASPSIAVHPRRLPSSDAPSSTRDSPSGLPSPPVAGDRRGADRHHGRHGTSQHMEGMRPRGRWWSWGQSVEVGFEEEERRHMRRGRG
jgi:hypothetical protein